MPAYCNGLLQQLEMSYDTFCDTNTGGMLLLPMLRGSRLSPEALAAGHGLEEEVIEEVQCLYPVSTCCLPQPIIHPVAPILFSLTKSNREDDQRNDNPTLSLVLLPQAITVAELNKNSSRASQKSCSDSSSTQNSWARRRSRPPHFYLYCLPRLPHKL